MSRETIPYGPLSLLSSQRYAKVAANSHYGTSLTGPWILCRSVDSRKPGVCGKFSKVWLARHAELKIHSQPVSRGIHDSIEGLAQSRPLMGTRNHSPELCLVLAG